MRQIGKNDVLVIGEKYYSSYIQNFVIYEGLESYDNKKFLYLFRSMNNVLYNFEVEEVELTIKIIT